MFCNALVCVCVGVLVIRVLVFTVFLYCLYPVFGFILFMYIYSYLFFSVLVLGLLPPSDNTIAVSNTITTSSTKIFSLGPIAP